MRKGHTQSNLVAAASADLTRTTNSCEGFHPQFNVLFYQSHPNIFLFTYNLELLQREVYIKLKTFPTHLKKIHCNEKLHSLICSLQKISFVFITNSSSCCVIYVLHTILS